MEDVTVCCKLELLLAEHLKGAKLAHSLLEAHSDHDGLVRVNDLIRILKLSGFDPEEPSFESILNVCAEGVMVDPERVLFLIGAEGSSSSVESGSESEDEVPLVERGREGGLVERLNTPDLKDLGKEIFEKYWATTGPEVFPSG